MKFSAAQIASILEGEVEGNPEIEVFKLSKIEEGEPGSLTFLSNRKYTSFIYSTNASITIVNKHFSPEEKIRTTLMRLDNAHSASPKLLEYYNMVKLNKSGIEEPIYKTNSAVFGENIYIGAFSYVGEGVKVGNNVKIFPNVYLGDNVIIGD